MPENAGSKLSQRLCRAAIAMVAIGIAVAPTLHAKPNSRKMEDKPANVIAHVELSGVGVTRMLLVNRNGKEYLVLGLDSSSGVALLDVSEPSKPQIIDMAARLAVAPAAELKVVAGTLTFFGTSGAETGASSGPKEIRSLSGVTAFVKDKHGLIYATNGDGLWIVKTKQRADSDEAAPDNYGGGG
jgi:hypothetical protein